MLIIPPPVFRPRRRRATRTVRQAPAALVLVAATYSDSDSVTLTFDRAVNAAGLVASAISVDDGNISGRRFVGDGPATVVSPQTVRIGLLDAGESTVPDTELTASAATGIVAVNDGGTWLGVTDLALPFG